MKKIIITESQFKNLINEYLDKNNGIPLFKYFNMNYNDKFKILYNWGIKNGFVQNYYSYEEEGFDVLMNYIKQIIEVEGFDFSDNFDEEINCRYNDLIERLEYNSDEFFNIIFKSYELTSDLYNHLASIGKTPTYCIEAPAFLFFSQPQIVKNEWLVHFSDNAFHIAQDGFLYGTQDINSLAYTGCGDIEGKFGEGYDFAYYASSANDVYYCAGNTFETPKYGSEFVLFRASGVSVFHDGDEERQVIFYGPSAKSIIYIRKDVSSSEYYEGSEIWQVCDINTRRVIYETDDLEEVIEWAINNYEQYKNRIVSYNKNNDYERNYI